MASAARKLSTYQDYLAIDAESDGKHEFYDGQVLAMSGGSPTHAQLATNLAIRLGSAVLGSPCRGYSSDLRVRVPASGLATYPDLSFVCGPFVAHPEDPDACTNPSVLVEVLSPSTEAYDRGEKFAHYRRLPSLQEYLLVAQDQQRIEQFSRGPDGGWLLVEHGPGAVLSLPCLNAELRVDEVYQGVELVPAVRWPAGAGNAG